MQQGGGSHSQSHQFTFSGVAGGGGGDQSGQKQHNMVVEEASPISSRPPATDEFGFPTMDALARAAAEGEDPDRGGGSSGGGNRWPRQETLALLKIRSEMDTAFRDATVKGPLWEVVSRKMGELGYRRNAKKCREKFENVDKYYKRTKEGRGGRQDGKSYKFFTELEALHSTSTSAAAPSPFTVQLAPLPPRPSNVIGIGFSSPMPISSVRPAVPPHFPAAVAPSPVGLEFSSNSSSSSPETEDDDDLDNEGTDMDGEPSNTAGSSRKRKRGSSGGSNRRMMEFFQGLMKQVMQKQDTMQQKCLEVIERREQERLMREEAWRRQEMARLAQEHEIMARERAVAASRDSSILSLLHKVTGQTVQLIPTPVSITAVATPPTPVPAPSSQPITPQAQSHQLRQSEIAFAAVPEQQLRVHDEPASSSRWPKTEVLALIRVRSGLEPRYQEAVPKGPLWEEISGIMQRMGYKRSAKRCKEKWENINKYFKKVKESNKKRPEDAKTCPYFHELDTLYRNKVLGSEGGSQLRIEAQLVGGSQQVHHQTSNPETTTVEEAKVEGHDSGDAVAKKPEDTVKERHLDLHDESGGRHQTDQQLNIIRELRNEKINGGELLQLGRGSGIADEEDDETMDDYDDDDDDEEDDDEDLEEERKMGYKIEFQQQMHNNAAAGPPNGGGNGAATSFLAMVQ